MILAIMMLFAFLPTNAFAEDTAAFSDVDNTAYYSDAANALAQDKVLLGYPDGTFGAEKSITRAEMVAVVCRAIGKEAEVESAKNEAFYSDVKADHWAIAYINYATRTGIVSGDGNGKFRPDDDVKLEEAVKMIVCSLGFAKNAVTDPSDWSKVYFDIAEKKGITANITGTKGKAASRADIAVMTYVGINAPKNDVTEDKKEEEEPKKESTIIATMGGGGSSSSSTPTTLAISAAALQVDGASVTTANVGDVLTLTTTPAAATGTIKWTVGGNEIAATGSTYTVSALDMGKTIKVEITGTGSYTGTASAECAVASTTQVNAGDIMSNDVDSSPVVLTNAQTTTFLDDNGDPVAIDETSTLTLSIDNPDKTPEEVSAAEDLVIQGIIENAATTVTDNDLDDMVTVAVDVDLSVGETAVHPVGAVTVTLSAEQLGLPAGTDLTNYSFSANHTNKSGANETVDGTLVVIDDVQYIRFELNGLSTIWIGNIPPRTVSFYNTEEDADNKVNSIGSVVVKFGDLTPTQKIPNASRSGYLFCGWNYDMTRTPIISNLEVHALWVEGEKLSADNIIVALSEATEALTFSVSDGLVSFDCENPETLPSGLTAKISVSAPANAFKYYAGTDAAVVAAFNNAEEYLDVNAVNGIYFEIDVTDESGVIIPSSTTYYYKWIDESGEAIVIEQVEAKVANGSDSATSMSYTANVNRGIGTFEAYLIDNGDATKDYVGYINNNLSGKATEGYTLNNNVSFDGHRADYDFNSYDVLKFVFTPFEGESFSNGDTITATGEYDNADTWIDNWTGTYQIVEGQLIVTYPFNASSMTDDYAWATITVNGNSQEIDVSWHNGGYGEETEQFDCETWAEVLTKLQSVSSTKEYYIDCDDSSAITLSNSLSIPANVRISLQNCPSFTIANGATLTMNENKDRDISSDLYIRNGDFIVANGGAITTAFSGTDHGTTYLTGIQAKNIKINSGATVTVPRSTGLTFNPSNSSDSPEDGVFTLENGGTISNSGHFHVNNFDVVNLNGTINATGYPYFHCDEININGTINLSASDYYGRLELYGTVNVGENGSIVVNNTGIRKYTNLEIYGPLTNNGSIEIKGAATNAEIMNNGFVNYNIGTISVASGCSITTSGTKFINTGSITGAGTLNASLGDDFTNYDDGTEYVEAEDGYWDEDLGEYVYSLSEYSRYKYTHDPAETVDVALYLAEVINMGNGTCTLSVNAESFPQN